MYRFVLVAALTISFAVPSNAGATDVEPRVIFNTHCGTCHTVREGDHRLGPSLYGIVGKEAGKTEGYGGYSGSLKGLTWDEDTLNRFMADPNSVASGTNMIFPPLHDADRRQIIIDYIKSASAP